MCCKTSDLEKGMSALTARDLGARLGGIKSIDAEDDQFAYRYDTQLLIDRRDEDVDEDAISDYITEHLEGNKTAY